MKMNMKDFSKYLRNKSFDDLLHRIRKISMERIAEGELSARIIFRQQHWARDKIKCY